MPALRAALIPTVATGIPGGICTIDNSESQPSMVALIGTPITGMLVIEAITPGKAAAIPAPAIITFKPLPEADFANFSTSSGVLCAERALISNGTCSSFRIFAASSITGRSEVLPIIILTSAFILFSSLRDL